MAKESLEQQLQKSFLWLERYQGNTPQLIKENLAIAQKQILELIATTENQAKIRAGVNKIMSEAFLPFEESLLGDKDKVQELSFNATNVIMAQWSTIPAIKLPDASAAVKKRLANPNTLVQGHKISDHMKHLDRTTTRKLQGQILQGFENGQGIQEINRNIRNTLGILERNQLNTLTRTTLLESIRDAQGETFDYFKDEIIAYYYDAVMDSRTTPRCFDLNGMTSKNRQDITKLLNFHYQCRSILGVKTDLSEEFDQQQKQNLVQFDGRTVNHRDGTKSTKFSVDKVKKIDINATPEQAFKAFDKSFQIDYMGRTRYDLWASGKASFKDMVSKTRNTFIPLDQLEKKLNL